MLLDNSAKRHILDLAGLLIFKGKTFVTFIMDHI
jgi:hypothetical protein